MMKTKRKNDLENVSKREKTFSTLAKEEGQGTAKRLKKDMARGYTESAKDDRWELKVDKEFAKTRAGKAKRLRAKIGK